jgi:integrase
MHREESPENIDRHYDALDLDSIGWGENDPAFMYLQSLAPGSRRSQWSAVRRIANILSGGTITDGVFPWEKLKPEDVTRLRQTLIDKYAPATGRRYLSTLRAVIEFTYIRKLLTVDERDRLIHKRNLSPIRGSSPPPGRPLDLLEVSKYLESCFRDDTRTGARDAAIFSILYCGGLRGREVINLDLADIKLRSGDMRIHGKGRKQRDLVLSESAIETIRKWLSYRGRKAGPLFLPFGPGDELVRDRRMSYQALAKSLRRRAELAGVLDFNPHDLRRTFVSDLLRDGARLDVVSHACGHSDTNTTAKYSRRKEKESARMTRGRELPQINFNERRKT